MGPILTPTAWGSDGCAPPEPARCLGGRVCSGWPHPCSLIPFFLPVPPCGGAQNRGTNPAWEEIKCRILNWGRNFRERGGVKSGTSGVSPHLSGRGSGTSGVRPLVTCGAVLPGYVWGGGRYFRRGSPCHVGWGGRGTSGVCWGGGAVLPAEVPPVTWGAIEAPGAAAPPTPTAPPPPRGPPTPPTAPTTAPGRPTR